LGLILEQWSKVSKEIYGSHLPPLVAVSGPSIGIRAGQGSLHLNPSVIHEGDMERGSGKP
jgi:hypothetical protein